MFSGMLLDTFSDLQQDLEGSSITFDTSVPPILNVSSSPMVADTPPSLVRAGVFPLKTGMPGPSSM